MPDPRPLPSLRLGAYDEPPATSDPSTYPPGHTRLRRALQLSDPRVHTSNSPSGEERSRRRSQLGTTTRRRQRSQSTHGDQPASTPEASGGDDGRRRRTKRRRIAQSPSRLPMKQPIKYGYYGQVEPGRLVLDLISCDGGEHRDSRHPATSLGPDNMLRHDKSVYCSDRPYTNIVLRHADDTPFCLEKLHIVGPEHGFTAPVREGLVYVAMTMKDLEKYIDPPPHARLSGIHSPPYRRRRVGRMDSLRSSPERLTLSDALRDPEINAALDDATQDYPVLDEVHLQSQRTAESSYYGNDFGFGRTDPEAHCEIPTSDTLDTMLRSGDERSDARPITLLSDEDPGIEDTSSQEVLDFRLQRLRLARRRFELEHWDREDRWGGLNRLPPDPPGRDRDMGMYGLSRLDALMARSRVHDSATPELETPVPYLHPTADDTGVEEALEDKNVTCARFHIKRGKHKVAIRFDPQVSGCFILLKVWANKSNVDVQSVIAKGYGGPRFFPARDFR